MDLSIVMISKDEEKAIKTVIPDIKKSLKNLKCTWEIFIVDSSRDKTAEIAQKLGARVEKQFPPKGYGRAMMRALTEAKGDILITLDCDDTYPAEIIPKLYNLCKNKYCIVSTNRIKKKSKNMPLGNYIANKSFSLFASMLFLKDVGDLHTGMRAYRKEVINHIKKHLNPNYSALPVDLILLPTRMNYKFKDIEISYKPRLGEVTLNKWNTVISTFKRILAARLRYFPKDVRNLNPAF